MLTDLGLQTPDEIEKHNRFLQTRAESGGFGCIGALICDNCNHLISDSVCLCRCVFTCPNCGFRNGKEVERMMDKTREMKLVKFPFLADNFGTFYDGVSPGFVKTKDAPEDYSI